LTGDNNRKTIDEMILSQVQDNRKAIGGLDLKVDGKFEAVEARINEETAAVHKRINPIEADVKVGQAATKSLSGRVRWIVRAIWSIVLMLLGVFAGIIFGGRL